jgi:hypothetical protein
VTPTPASRNTWDPNTRDGVNELTPVRKDATGMLGFAVIILATFGFFNVIDGILAIFQSHVFVGDAHYVIGDLRAWGWVILIFGVLQTAAAVAIYDGRSWGRWFGIVVIALNLLAQLMFLPSYPFWAMIAVAVDVIALYALCVYGGRPIVEGGAGATSGAWSRYPSDVTPYPPS